MDDWGASDLARRLANLIRVATIIDLDDAKALARVQCAAVPASCWMPILTTRAGPDRSYWLPEPGEQVLVLSPSGDTAQGVVLPALYQDNHGPPAADRHIHRTEYVDGTFTEYDRKAHTLRVHCVGEITLIASKTTIDSDLEVNGGVTAAGDVIGNGISLDHHRHGGVKSGGSSTGAPE